MNQPYNTRPVGGQYGNQQSNWGRYQPPMIQTAAQGGGWTGQGGYGYNLPNAFGSTGLNYMSGFGNFNGMFNPFMGNGGPQQGGGISPMYPATMYPGGAPADGMMRPAVEPPTDWNGIDFGQPMPYPMPARNNTAYGGQGTASDEWIRGGDGSMMPASQYSNPFNGMETTSDANRSGMGQINIPSRSNMVGNMGNTLSGGRPAGPASPVDTWTGGGVQPQPNRSNMGMINPLIGEGRNRSPRSWGP
jgi:hypothetical protein